jgi:hypothetical protein
MKVLSVTVYEFDELSDEAKKKAREWWREGALNHDWWEGVYDDAITVGLKIKSFDLDRNRHAKGEFIHSAPKVAELILKDHGDTCETYKTASAFLKERDEAIDTAIKDENGEIQDERALDQKLDDIESDFLKSILEDYSIILQKEYEYQLSDEVGDETIMANGYTFTEDGERQG